MITSKLVPVPLRSYEREANVFFHLRRVDAGPEPEAVRCVDCGARIVGMSTVRGSHKAKRCTLCGILHRTGRAALASLLLILALVPSLVHAQAANMGSNSSPVVNRQGIPLGGVNIAVCQPLATTAATVTSNLVTLTMASNPVTAGFVPRMQILVAGFTGADTYLNAGTLANGQLTGGWTISSVTPTTITFSIIHANTSASTNGTVLQQGNSTTPCAALATVYSDTGLTAPVSQPFQSDQLGNWNVFVPAGSGGGGGGSSITVNGGSALPSPVNFQNGPSFQGIIINALNPSGSNVDYQLSGTATESLLPAASVFTDQSATFGAHTYDFSASTLFKLRVAAGLTTAANGSIGYDTTNANLHAYIRGADSLVMTVPASSSITNADCAQFSNTGGSIGVSDSGGPCSNTPPGFLTANYVNATTSFTNVSGWSFPVLSNTNYGMTCQFTYSETIGATRLEMQITGPASPTAVEINFSEFGASYSGPTYQLNNAAAFSTPVQTGQGCAIGSSFGPCAGTLTMTLINGANSGTIQVQAAATSAGTNAVTIYPGYCKLN